MATEKKKNTETGKSQNRDKNGKFAGNSNEEANKKDDGKVEIKIVKDSDKKDDDGDTTVKSSMFFSFSSFPKFPESPKTHEFSKEDVFAEFEELEKKIAEEYPDVLKFDDKKYFSQDAVVKIIAETILTCAKVSANMEEEAAVERKEVEKAEKQLRNRKIAEKISKILANIFMAVIVFGLGCASVFGVIQFFNVLMK